MNATPNPAEFALALYATANETHQRKDWRLASHALAEALRLELLRTTAVTAPPAAANDSAPRASVKRAPKASGPLSYTMTAESLTAALRLVCRVVDKRNSIPILTQCLLEAGRDVITIRATNLDREMFVSVQAPGCGKWAATCDAHRLAALLRQAKGPVTIVGETTDVKRGAQNDPKEGFLTRVTLGGAVSATLQGLPVQDFPKILKPDTAPLQRVTISAAALRDALTFVKLAISAEETRYYLNGAYLCDRVTDGRRHLEVCATDGSRMNVLTLDGQAPIPGAIIPRDTVADMLAVPASEPFDLAMSPQYLQMVSGPVVITSRLIDGNYPDYHRVIPKDGGDWVTFDTAELGGALAKVSAISNEKSRSVRFTLRGGACAMLCRNMEGAESSETVACDFDNEVDKEFAFNATYFREALAALDCQRVRILLGGPNDPARLESADEGADGRLCVAMPLRV